jgi:hypothetical protein
VTYSNQSSKITLFADDTTLLVSSQSRKELEIKCFKEANILTQSFIENYLHINVLKTKFMEFEIRKNAKEDFNLNILIDDTYIEKEKTI